MEHSLEPTGRMIPYAPEHLAALTVAIIATIALVSYARKIRGTDAEDRLLSISGWVILLGSLAWTAWELTPGQWNVNQSLPFHFSDALRFITGIALITRAGWAIAISFFWGLTLNLQSLITPDVNYYDLLVLEFTQYWFFHIAVFIAPIVLVWGLGYQPTWRGYRVAYLGAVIWAVIAFSVNSITGANYAYLSHGPEGASILDLLGPWPIYIFWEAIIIAVVWALMTMPFETPTLRKHAILNPSGTLRRRPPRTSPVSTMPKQPPQHRSHPITKESSKARN